MYKIEIRITIFRNLCPALNLLMNILRLIELLILLT